MGSGHKNNKTNKFVRPELTQTNNEEDVTSVTLPQIDTVPETSLDEVIEDEFVEEEQSEPEPVVEDKETIQVDEQKNESVVEKKVETEYSGYTRTDAVTVDIIYGARKHRRTLTAGQLAEFFKSNFNVSKVVFINNDSERFIKFLCSIDCRMSAKLKSCIIHRISITNVK